MVRGIDRMTETHLLCCLSRRRTENSPGSCLIPQVPVNYRALTATEHNAIALARQ